MSRGPLDKVFRSVVFVLAPSIEYRQVNELFVYPRHVQLFGLYFFLPGGRAISRVIGIFQTLITLYAPLANIREEIFDWR